MDKKVQSCIVIVTAMLVTLFLFTGCNSDKQAGGTSFLMDTVVTVELTARDADTVYAEILQELNRFEQQYSMYVESSDIAKINAEAGNDYVPVHEDTYKMLKEAVELCAQSEGKFDITVGPLVELWDVNGENPQIPEVTEELLRLVNYEELLFNDDETSVMLAKEGQKIDLGGLAKGAACDEINQLYAEKQPERALVSLGGNIVGTGQAVFRIGIQDPRNDAEYMGIVEMKENQIIATSGDYQRYFEIDGRRYHHILDPKTGYPVESDFMSVTVLSEDGMLGDYLSTVLFMMSKEELLQLSGAYSFVAIDHEKNVYLSDDLQGKFTIENEGYRLSE